ncbi:efflux RND transporter permease subunit [Laribacter hongkongensis]|uniref:Efflux pump membrane transporter n=1 Tax=Laribacter hongkongensis TaxID=168471 RepID=A0A248LJR3_9NEIS|nr:efflux RND transporter permease subunit [Laribacter hongkongensis]ASJ25020.1 transporter, hydrophobe/amphiphile efflux-1 (HAE1) family [Laribacter hongkongensis]MBE5529888.1 multidrug efflux RND transporter permease [Laribacter hongkongensis]MCG8992330.1 efflux RND transporter permease subunit [Laribacter hongkongensis]MCG8993855.1 efflux RND transporter permease subunit [Laribacter hongkongensis]MCG8997464.1 efflux RND transporter permease subunit [Laribacter hongkongensis]
MARFFIDRPIFAWVIAIVIMLAGALSVLNLPVAQYPQIAPPTVQISATYPGASAKTVEDTVTQVIEQNMKGIDHLTYMSSTSDSSGSVEITLTFDANTNPDTAQVQVQNKLSLATPLLPQEVQRQGITVTKSATNFLMVMGFVSEDGSMSNTDLADYIAANVQDIIARVPGVGEVNLFGSQYAMRIWLDPARLQQYALTPADIRNAIQAQNAQVSAGQLGGTPALPGQQLNATVTAQSRLKTPAEFENILLRSTGNGANVYLKDVAKVELGSESYSHIARFNGKPAAGLGIKLATGANALDTAAALKAKVQDLQTFMPQGMKVVVPYDTTPFVKLSIESVVQTLFEAVILVFVVMYLFLQNFRATLIPTIAVPVVLLGTFGVLFAFGYSINTLTMFAMVLAIGLLVDDAIVVVENVERIMSEEGLSPREATRKSMDQITGALIGIALVLSAVFVPMAFFGGSTGVIYRQFSVTIVSAMVLSVIIALVLTPALCATLLKPVAKGHSSAESSIFGRIFIRFNRWLERLNGGTQNMASRMISRSVRYMVIYGLIVAGMAVMFMRLPSSFLPDEDQGMMFTMVQLPAGATQERTMEVVKQVEKHFLENETDSVASIFSVAGFSFAGNGQNMALGFVGLKDWKERKAADRKVQAVAGRAMGAFAGIKDAMAFAFAPPAVVELGNATGFDLQLQDRAGLGHDALMQARNQLLGMAAQNPALMAVRPNGQEDMPEYQLDIDFARAGALGLSTADINDALSTAWGGSYVNDFIDKGRVKKVYIQGEASTRMLPEDLNKWYVRNSTGEMVPFSAFASAHWTYGSPRLERYNGLPSVQIQGQAAPGHSTGEAMLAMEQLVAQLPAGIGYEWTGLSYQERMAGSQAPMLYALSILVIFLCLAALYESWSIPFSVMLVVPLGIIGALAAAMLFKLSNDVYFQVGLLTTIGLASKNAILIVEFAKDLAASGHSLLSAALTAVRLRLRPILMTSFAFILGVLPLAVSNGAGAGAQNALGIGVIGGMITGTVLAVIFVPLFFVVIRRVFDGQRHWLRPRDNLSAHEPPAADPTPSEENRP